MSKWVWAGVGLIAINVILVIYEKGVKFWGWKLYFAVAGLLLFTALIPQVACVFLGLLLIHNLLANTSKIRKKIGG